MTGAHVRHWVGTAGFGLALLPGAARAHLVATGLGPVYDGAAHFALSPEDYVPIAGAALLVGLRGEEHARPAVLILPLAWLSWRPPRLASWRASVRGAFLVALPRSRRARGRGSAAAGQRVCGDRRRGGARPRLSERSSNGRVRAGPAPRPRLKCGNLPLRLAHRCARGRNDGYVDANRVARSWKLDRRKRPPAPRLGAPAELTHA